MANLLLGLVREEKSRDRRVDLTEDAFMFTFKAFMEIFTDPKSGSYIIEIRN